MPSDDYNGHAHNRKAPAGPVTANSSAPSLVTVDAPTPTTDPRVVTASRRKVVGVDCVESFPPIWSATRQGTHQGARRVRPRCTSGACADRDHTWFGGQ